MHLCKFIIATASKSKGGNDTKLYLKTYENNDENIITSIIHRYSLKHQLVSSCTFSHTY